jgi:hypothetical protein
MLSLRLANGFHASDQCPRPGRGKQRSWPHFLARPSCPDRFKNKSNTRRVCALCLAESKSN